MKIHFLFKCIFKYKIAPNMALKKRMSKRSNYYVSMKKSNSIKTIFVTIQPATQTFTFLKPSFEAP